MTGKSMTYRRWASVQPQQPTMLWTSATGTRVQFLRRAIIYRNFDQVNRVSNGYAVSVLMREPALSGPVGKALWFIESHFAEEISLDDVAAAAGVSRYHMSRAFSVATGQSVMRYARARRLTESAKALANGAPDILRVAIDAGYGSHEAFTRAFRDQFGITPEMFREQATTEHPLLLEPIRMDETLLT